MRLPTGSAFTLLSIAAGVVAAAVVSTAWYPMIRDREQRALDDQARQLEMVSVLAVDQLLTQLTEGPSPLLESAPRDTPDGAPDSVLNSVAPPAPERVMAVRTIAEASLSRIAALTDLERMILVDRRGRLLGAVPQRAAPLYGDTLADPALLACRLDLLFSEHKQRRADFRDSDRSRRQAICMPVRTQAGAVLGALVVVGDSDAVLRATRQSGRDALLLVAFATLAGLVSIAGARRLLRPLRRVSQAAARIAAGERGVRVEIGGPEEIQQLAHAMNALASSVENREDEIGSRMQVVQQLSRMVAHEVRNPLQSLSLLVTLARTEPEPESRDKQLALIEDEIHVLEGVVQRFLSQSGPLRVALSRCDLGLVIERAAALAYPRAAASNIRLRIQAPPRLALVADATLVRRALENLILNALEFAGKAPGRSGQVTVSLVRGDGEVHLVVDDDGPGVPLELRSRIFEADVTSKPGGTGLGLALVRQVFDAHGGTIRCEDSPLGGARFVATLPLSPLPPVVHGETA